MDVFLYLLASYCGVGALTGVLWGASRKRGADSALPPLALIPLWLLPLLPYGVVGCQTSACRTFLTPPTQAALREIGFSDQILFFRVLRIASGAATVYVVTPCSDLSRPRDTERCAVVLHLKRNGPTWRSDGDYDVIWSDCGSADGNVFPPYPAKGDYP